MALDQKSIIMNFSAPPGLEDIEVIAREIIASLPDELLECCDELSARIEDFADEATMQQMELEDPYELIAMFRSGKEISPGVQKKLAGGDDVITLYRRPILDLWCEMQEDLTAIIREVIIEELGQNFEFSEEDIEEMTARHHQGMF